jgi:hypothetical protein
MSESLFLRLLSHDDKPAALAEAVRSVQYAEGSRQKAEEDNTASCLPPADYCLLPTAYYLVDPASFSQVPGSPFAYWVSERIRRLFTELPPFESEGRHATKGLATTEDFTFVRLWWEPPTKKVLNVRQHGSSPGRQRALRSLCRSQILDSSRWVPFAKGGEYSPYYSDLHLLVDWQGEGQSIKDYLDKKIGRPGQWSRWINALDFYFCGGLTWSRRSQRGLSVRTYPGGCIFADKGPAIFAEDDQLPFLLSISNSRAFHSLVALHMAFGSYEVGVIQRTPVPDLSGAEAKQLGSLALHCVEIKRDLDTANETSHVFHLPALLQIPGGTLAERIAGWRSRLADADRQLAENQRQIDEIAFHLYGIDGNDRRAIEESVGSRQKEVGSGQDAGKGHVEEDEENVEAGGTAAEASSLVGDLLSHAVGCVVGRWDIRLATGAQHPPELPDPFAPLPVCSPGMLQGPDGLPANSEDVSDDYPLRIDWDGILVDDEGHQDDIVQRVREVLEAVWDSRQNAVDSMQEGEGETACRSLPTAYSIEREACEILGVKSLRDYFKKPGKGGFWDDHVKRYSKSRRKAPIYWLLQSSKKNYALWLYYHRLDKDILFKALLNYVEPKIQREENRLADLRSRKSSGDSGKGAKKLDREIEKQEDLLSELRDFAEKLRRAADLHLTPDLNDGVVLNIAPLHELVPWKEAKKYWQELLAGKYEWSSIGKQLREKGLVK